MKIKSFKLFVESLIFDKSEIENNQVLKRNEIGGWDKSSFDDLSVYF